MHRSSTVYKLKNSSKYFYVRGTTGDGLFHCIITDYGLKLTRGDNLKVKCLHDGFVSCKHAGFHFTRC